MKARHAFIALLAFGVSFASLAEAQRAGRRGNARMDKRTGEQSEQVQLPRQRGPAEGAFAALELTDEQKEAFQAMRESHREEMQAQRETGERPTQEEMEAFREQHQAAVAEILTDEQFAQLEELRANRPGGQDGRGRRGGMRGQRGIRPQGAESAFAALELTDEQQELLQTFRETQRVARQERRESGDRPSQEEIDEIREQHQAAIAEILTDEQLTQLEELRANRPRWGASEDAEAGAAAAKPVGAAIESSSWADIKAQMR